MIFNIKKVDRSKKWANSPDSGLKAVWAGMLCNLSESQFPHLQTGSNDTLYILGSLWGLNERTWSQHTAAATHTEAQWRRKPLQRCALGVEFHLLSQDDSGIPCESKLGGNVLWPPEDDTKEFWFLSLDQVAFCGYLTLQHKSAGNLALWLIWMQWCSIMSLKELENLVRFSSTQ